MTEAIMELRRKISRLLGIDKIQTNALSALLIALEGFESREKEEK